MKQSDIEEMETAIIGAARGNIQIIDSARAIAIGLCQGGYRKERYCKNISNMHPVDCFLCSECGFEMSEYVETVTDTDDDPPDIYYKEFAPRFCPKCGAKVKEV